MSDWKKRTTLNRRTLIAGAAAGAGLAAAGVGIATLAGDADKELVSPTAIAQDETQTNAPAAVASAPSGAPAQLASRAALQMPQGMALVTSPRLPLFGVGSQDAADLLAGALPSWLEVGSPIELPVEPLALEGQVAEGSQPVQTYSNYEQLVAGLNQRIGGVALIPVDQVDFRVNVLAVDGVDPLRDIPNESDPLIRIGVVGDIVPGRNVGNKMREYGYTHPFKKVAAELGAYHITFANLEGNLSSNIEPPADPHTFTFIASPEMIEGMQLAGIDAVSLANNHSKWNSEGWGEAAFLDTMDALSAAGMPYFGGGRDLAEASAPWVATVGGHSIAIIGIDGVTANEAARADGATVYGAVLGEELYAGAGNGVSGTNPYALEQVLTDISAAADQYDIVIPYFHFGIEYVGVVPQWAAEGARAAIDAGATTVVTNHPHVIQGMEVYKGKPIVYSVGNFIFDQMFSVETRQGLILELDFRDNRVVGLRCRGVEIEDFNQPRLMTAGEHASLMDRFWWSTDRLASRG
ncbi:MAG: CapA family protein [Thermomicrobiales bacterium]|nr:CapA family protein [Thermomicrobiales bacterium]